MACRGVEGWGAGAMVARASRTTRRTRGVELRNVATAPVKAELYRRLWLGRGEGEGFPPGWVHLPAGIGAEWVRQLVAERLVTARDRRGFARREWRKLRERNEALDCAVLARAALHELGADRRGEGFWARLAPPAGRAGRGGPGDGPRPAEAAAPAGARRGGRQQRRTGARGAADGTAPAPTPRRPLDLLGAAGAVTAVPAMDEASGVARPTSTPSPRACSCAASAAMAPGHLTPLDAPLLARLCLALDYADEATAQVRALGLLGQGAQHRAADPVALGGDHEPADRDRPQAGRRAGAAAGAAQPGRRQRRQYRAAARRHRRADRQVALLTGGKLAGSRLGPALRKRQCSSALGRS